MASIVKIDKSTWQARYRDDTGKQRAKRFRRKIDAENFLTQIGTSMLLGQYVDPDAGKVTFASYYATWAENQVWVPGTKLAMDLATRGVAFGAKPLNKIKRSDVEAWVAAMNARGLKPGTIRTRFNNVRGVFKAAIRDRLIASDPSDEVTLPRDRRREAAMSLPTVEQVGQLVRADDYFGTFVALCAFAGLRLGEAAALQVSDVDFLRRQINVARQVQRAGKDKIELRAPKYGSERVVYIAPELTELLSRHVERHVPAERSPRWLFLGDSGNPAHQSTVGYWWRKACKTASVTGFTLHDLRHFYASGLIADGCDVVTVQRALGHAKATTTLNTYAHLWPTAEDRTRSAASGLMTAALADPAVHVLCTPDASTPAT